MKKYCFYFLHCFTVCFISLLILSCSHHRIARNTTLITTSGFDDSTCLTDVALEPGSDTLRCVEIFSLISDGTAACADGRYADAHMIFSEALNLIVMISGPEMGDSTFLDDYYFSIADAYARIMPPQYLDSIPDELASLVFHTQMLLSFDSLAPPSRDAIERERTICQKGISYNFPIVWNERVFRALCFYRRDKHGPVAKWLERANYYLPFMQSMFAENGLPTDLAYLPLIESGFNPKAYSFAHAAGIWQFIESTGKIYGLRKNYWLDERRDPIKSTDAAIRYLKRLYSLFGDWPISLAAYNCGENGIARSMIKSKQNAFWDLPLPRETMNYVPQFIGALMVAKNPQCFGYNLGYVQPMQLDTLYTSVCVELSAIAQKTGVSLEKLKQDNPHLLQWCTPPDVKNVLLYLPYGSADTVREFLAQLPPELAVHFLRYTIKRGESLASISRRFNLPSETIRSFNKLSSNRLSVGKVLYLPFNETSEAAMVAASKNSTVQGSNCKKPVRYQVKAGDNLSALADMFNVSVSEICKWNNLTNANELRAGSTVLINSNISTEEKQSFPQSGKRYYQVKKGDNLNVIARTLSVSANQLAVWNRKARNDMIHPGEKLVYFVQGQQASKPVSVFKKPTISPSPKPTAVNNTSTYIQYEVAPGDNLSTLADFFSIDVATLKRINNLPENGQIKAGNIIKVPRRSLESNKSGQRKVVYYKVKNGDTLWDIALQYNVPVDQIYRFNGLEPDSKIRPGDTVKILVMENR